MELPTVNECKLILDSNALVSWSHLLPSNLGVRVNTNKSNERHNESETTSCSMNLFEQDYDENNTTIQKPNTRLWKEPPLSYYKTNNMHVDNVMHADPGSNMAIEKIIEYLESATNMSDKEIDECRRTTGEDPVRTIIAAGTADGAPAKQWIDF